MRKWARRLLALLLLAAVGFGIGVAVRAPVCLPFDYVVNLVPTCEVPELRAAADGKRRVVFLQHGLWRTNYSLWRLERTLRQHGYEVFNTGYRSTAESIEEHAARLRQVVAARLAEGEVDELSFVGHSMGGLVIQEFLRGENAPTPHACVYLATPHRGAMLADLRRHWFLFRFAMGEASAQQLATTDAFHEQPIPHGARSGTLVGDIGEGHGTIPGHDDGTISVAEATFPGAKESLRVPFGHTAITVREASHRQVLHFLKHLRFAPATNPR